MRDDPGRPYHPGEYAYIHRDYEFSRIKHFQLLQGFYPKYFEDVRSLSEDRELQRL